MQKSRLRPVDFGPKYASSNMLGHGSYGDVYEGVNIKTGQKVAIKLFKNLWKHKFIALRALREVTLLRRINYPKVIKIYDILPPKDPNNFESLAVVLQFMPMDLKKMATKAVKIDDLHIESIVYQMIVALKYLKSAKVLHRDLKPENILISKDLSEVKVCDFGLARQIADLEEPKSNDTFILDSLKVEGEKKIEKQKLTFHVVTRWYRAPEIILLQSQYGNAIEMWSVGCIFAELINIHQANKEIGFNYKPLFDGKACFPLSPPKNELVETYKNQNGFPHSQDDQISKIINIIGTPSEEDLECITDPYAKAYMKSFQYRPRKDLKKLFHYAKPEWIDFLEKTLVFNPKKRLDISEALEHPLFRNVRNKGIQFDAEQSFHNLGLHSGLTMEEIRIRFLEEIQYYKNKEGGH